MSSHILKVEEKDLNLLESNDVDFTFANVDDFLYAPDLSPLRTYQPIEK